jgi:hypothetical protein
VERLIGTHCQGGAPCRHWVPTLWRGVLGLGSFVPCGCAAQGAQLRGARLSSGVFIWILLLAPIFSGCSRETPENAVRVFFEDLAAGRYREAHSKAALRFQVLQSADQFGRAIRELGLEEFSQGIWDPAVLEGNRAEMEGVYENAAGVRTRLLVEVFREAGRWRVASIRKGGQGRAGEDLFSSIGRGRGLNPFVGRPAPGEAELRELVEGELSRLGEALRTGSFEAFHRGISQTWREQVPPRALQQIFGQMSGSGHDFSGLKRLRPAYDPVPYVDPRGILVVEGYYPSQPARLFFGMKFVSESSGWLLLGLDVQLR